MVFVKHSRYFCRLQLLHSGSLHGINSLRGMHRLVRPEDVRRMVRVEPLLDVDISLIWFRLVAFRTKTNVILNSFQDLFFSGKPSAPQRGESQRWPHLMGANFVRRNNTWTPIRLQRNSRARICPLSNGGNSR